MSNLLTKQRLADTEPNAISDEEIEQAILFEFEEWQKNGIDPEMVAYKEFMFDSMLQTMKTILVAKELITEDEFSLMVNQQTLSSLRFHRSQIMEQITKVRIMQGVTPGLIDQFGKPTI